MLVNKVVQFSDFERPEWVLHFRAFVPENVDLIVVAEDVEGAFNTVFNDFEKVHAAGGIVQYKSSILWIKRWGVWDLPKGKLEQGETIEHGAKREIEEECGVDSLKSKGLITTTYHTYFWKTQPVLKTTSWFLFSTNKQQKLNPQLEEDITDVVWKSKKSSALAAARSYRTIQLVFSKYLKKFG